jgi:O-antigen/teichoic acid export membrane protein
MIFKSKLLNNTSFYTIGNIIPQAAGFILLPLYTNYMTPEDFGIVSSMGVLSTILLLLFSLALDRAVYRLYFDYKTTRERRDYLGTTFFSIFIIASTSFVILLIFNSTINLVFKSIEFYPYFLLAIASTYFSTFSLIPKIYFQVSEKANFFLYFSLLQFISSTSLIIIYVAFLNQGAVGYLKGMMLGNILSTPISIYIQWKISRFRFIKKYIFENLKFSLPLIPGISAAWVMNLFDRIIIERYLNLHEVGIYSVGFKIAGLVLMLSSSIYLAYTPFFYKHAALPDQWQSKTLLGKMNNSLIIIILFVAFVIAFLSKEVIILFLDIEYYNAYKIVPIVSMAYVFSNLNGLFNLMIYQEKKVLNLMYINLFGAIVSITANVLLVPVLGILGSALSTLIVFVSIFFISWRFAIKTFYIKQDWSIILGIFSIMSLVYLAFEYFATSYEPFTVLLIKGIVIVLSLALLFILKRDVIAGLLQNNSQNID